MATDDVKVYTPEVVSDQPFPVTGGDPLTQSNSSFSSSNNNQVFGAKETQEQGFPLKMVAKELFSTAINTIQKKILKTFEFAKSGAIQIGEYINGLSGEIKISPDGIVAKNKDGNTTFALDGETGNAIFSGDVRASTFTSDYFNVDQYGNVVAQSIKLSSFLSASDTTAWGQPGFSNEFTTEGDHVVSAIDIGFDLVNTTLIGVSLRFDAVFDNIWNPLNIPTQTEADAEVYIYDTFNGVKTKLSTTLVSLKTQVGYPNYPTETDEMVLLTVGPIHAPQTYSNFSISALQPGRHKISLEVTYTITNTDTTDPSFSVSLPAVYVFSIGTV